MDFEGYLYKIGRQKSTIKKHLIRLNVINRELQEWTIEKDKRFQYEIQDSGSELLIRIKTSPTS